MPHDFVNMAQKAIGSGEGELFSVLPDIVARIIRDGLWSQAGNKEGQAFQSFREFCEYKLWWGLECPYDRVFKYCEHNDECRRLMLELEPMAGKVGRPTKDGNTIIKTPIGTTATNTLRRLKRDNPELARKVIDGELTANAAAVEAGFRRKMKSIPVGSAKMAITALLRVFTKCELIDAIGTNN